MTIVVSSPPSKVDVWAASGMPETDFQPGTQWVLPDGNLEYISDLSESTQPGSLSVQPEPGGAPQADPEVRAFQDAFWQVHQDILQILEREALGNEASSWIEESELAMGLELDIVLSSPDRPTWELTEEVEYLGRGEPPIMIFDLLPEE